jgi:hypothetical protein
VIRKTLPGQEERHIYTQWIMVVVGERFTAIDIRSDIKIRFASSTAALVTDLFMHEQTMISQK